MPRPIELHSFDQTKLHQFLKQEGIACLPESCLSNYVAMGSLELKEKMDAKWRRFLEEITPTLRSDTLPPADILAMDLALCQTPNGWDLAWVEVQAFTSMLGSFGSLLMAHQTLGNLTQEFAHDSLPKDVPWHSHAKQWMAPQNAVLIEDHPLERVGWGDFQASQYWWGVDIADWRDLRVEKGVVINPTQHTTYQHVLNRLVWSDLSKKDEQTARQFCLDAKHVSWHSHPAWYEQIHKGSLIGATMDEHEGCYWVEQSPTYAFEDGPSQWVFKEIQGHSSSHVILSPTLEDFRRLRQTEQRWLMQKKFSQISMGQTTSGQPLFGEIRCMVGLLPSQPPFVLAYLMRLSQNGIATLSGRTKKDGEGMTLLCFPSDHTVL